MSREEYLERVDDILAEVKPYVEALAKIYHENHYEERIEDRWSAADDQTAVMSWAIVVEYESSNLMRTGEAGYIRLFPTTQTLSTVVGLMELTKAV